MPSKSQYSSQIMQFYQEKILTMMTMHFLYEKLKNSVIFIDAKSRQICVWSIPQNSAQIVYCARRTRTFVLVCWSANWWEHPGILHYYPTRCKDKTKLNLANLLRIAKITDLKTSNFASFEISFILAVIGKSNNSNNKQNLSLANFAKSKIVKFKIQL